MFTLELDLVLAYDPPMSDKGRGICLTRTIELPFAPYNGLQIYSKEFDQSPGPEGFVLKDVIWDIDRGIFMGQIEMSSLDLPIEDIPLDIKSWLELGWRFGSYSDRYEQPEEESEEETEGHDTDDSFTDPDFEQQLKQPMLSPRKRSKQLNLVMRAMVRTMAELYNDLHVAYAMDKTKRHFTKRQLEDNKSKEAKEWLDAQDEYNAMSWKKRFEWRERVMKTHPRLDKLARP